MREGSNSSSKELPKELPNITFFFLFFLITGQIQYRPKFTSQLELAGIWPEFSGMDRNRPKFDPRWNVGYSGTSLHSGTKNFNHSGRNGIESITMLYITYYIYVCVYIYIYIYIDTYVSYHFGLPPILFSIY